MVENVVVHHKHGVFAVRLRLFRAVENPLNFPERHSVLGGFCFAAGIEGYKAVFRVEVGGVGAGALKGVERLVIAEIVINAPEIVKTRVALVEGGVVVAVYNIDGLAALLLERL